MPVLSLRTLFKIVRLSLTVSSSSGAAMFLGHRDHLTGLRIFEQDAAPVGLRENAEERIENQGEDRLQVDRARPGSA